MNEFKLVCIDDSNRPNEIRITNWIKKEKEYTLVKVLFNPIQNKRFVVLEEVKPDAPYGGYLIERFRISDETMELIKQAIKEGELEEELV